jgi:predicted ABC-type ATPase
MNLPILHRLKDGEKFDFQTLADSIEDVEQYWHCWWENADLGKISRPETIVDDDPILEETSLKTTVDSLSYDEFFNKFLHDALKAEDLPEGELIGREKFRTDLLKLICERSIKEQEPQIVFAGGGYGSGKTTILNRLGAIGELTLTARQAIGVDYFKLYIPEFSLIQSVSDGRASLTVQKECKAMADKAFSILIKEKKSFILDSSMSNKMETQTKISMAKSQGYYLTLIAVLTPIGKATSQAMRRARETRRFPHPDALPQSHNEFRRHFYSYLDAFDKVSVFANSEKCGNIPAVVAMKSGREKPLALLDDKLFNELLLSDD